MISNKTLRLIHSYILVAIGTFVLSFGSVIFLAKCELVSGGISGIAIHTGSRAVLSNRNGIHCFKESKGHSDKSRDENKFNT